MCALILRMKRNTNIILMLSKYNTNIVDIYKGLYVHIIIGEELFINFVKKIYY